MERSIILALVVVAAAQVSASKRDVPMLDGKFKEEGYHAKEKSYVSEDGYSEPAMDSYEEAEDDYVNEATYNKQDIEKDTNLKVTYDTSYIYQGKYPGKCSADGLYYKDEDSFVSCSNGNHYVQPCAPGTKNSGYDNYRPGGAYGFRDFCDVNLVDSGYSARHYHGYDGYGGYGYGGYNGGYNGGYYGGYRGHFYDTHPFGRYGFPGYGYPW